MARITLLVSDPGARRVEAGSADWVVSGTRPDRVADAIDGRGSFAAVVERVKSLPGEYTLCRIRTDGDSAFRAYRGVTSSLNLFYSYRPSAGEFVVGDHFRDVLSALPVSERTVPPEVPIDHLLFGTRPTGTYVSEVGRLGHGEALEWEPGGEPETELIERLSSDERMAPAAAKRRLDRYFRDTLDTDRFEGSVATMLSGGVDSTLLHQYLATDDTVSGAVNAPEFRFEVDYAREASDLLDSDHEFVAFDESEFLERVEATVDATGHPLFLPQTTLMHAAVAESPHRTFVNGGLADGLFGTGTAALAYLAQYVGGVSRFVPNVTWEVEQLEETADRL